jgi:uncharacterized membrane protein
MRKVTNLAIAIGASLCFSAIVQADGLRFTTLPQTVQATVVTYDQVRQNVSRYQLLEKKGTKEVYRDNRTGQKVTVKLENN